MCPRAIQVGYLPTPKSRIILRAGSEFVTQRPSSSLPVISTPARAAAGLAIFEPEAPLLETGLPAGESDFALRVAHFALGMGQVTVTPARQSERRSKKEKSTNREFHSFTLEILDTRDLVRRGLPSISRALVEKRTRRFNEPSDLAPYSCIVDGSETRKHISASVGASPLSPRPFCAFRIGGADSRYAYAGVSSPLPAPGARAGALS